VNVRPPVSRLVVCVDQVGLLRKQRRSVEPDPVHFALQAETAGAGGIRAHLRLDRRHIQEQDAALLVKMIKTRFFLQLSPNQDVEHLAHTFRPNALVLAAERRDEVTTESGLDVSLLSGQLAKLIRKIDGSQTRSFALVDPVLDQIRAAAKLEFHGILVNVMEFAQGRGFSQDRLGKVEEAVRLANKFSLETHLVNQISWESLPALAKIPGVAGIHIGHALVARSAFVGVSRAVDQFRQQIDIP
jgi:pyridoxine 5-phosphate synthase